MRQETLLYLVAELVKKLKYWRYYVRARMFFFFNNRNTNFYAYFVWLLTFNFRVLFSLFIDLNQIFFAFSFFWAANNNRITVIIINVNRVLHLINFAMTTSSYVGKTCQKLSPCIRLFGIN